MNDIRTERLDRSVIEVSTLDSSDDDARDLSYWRSKTPRERIAGIEFIRQSFYRYDPVSARLPRLLEAFERA